MLRAIVSELEGFSNPFKKYVVALIETILALRGRVNFTNLERQGEVSARTHGRWHRWAHPFREIIWSLPSGVLLVAMDATFIRKSDMKTPGLGRFWNGTAGLEHLKETKSDWPKVVLHAVFGGWYAKKTFVDGVLKNG